MKFTPHDYQKKAIKWLIGGRARALYLDPGMGKTAVALAALKAVQKHARAKSALVIAPKRVCYEVWSKSGELGKWDEFRDFKVALLHGPKKERAADGYQVDLYVVNFDGLPWLISSGWLDSLLKQGLGTLVVDELSKFKHPRTKRFKLIKPYLDKFVRRWALTGSPAPNGLMDQFGQAYIVDEGRALGQYITHYRNTFFVPAGYKGYEWKLQEGAEKRIYKRLKTFALTMRATDHLDLPKLVTQDLWVNLPPKAQKIYDKIEKDYIALVGDKVITAANAAVAGGKLRQVVSGGLYDSPEPGAARKTVEVHNEKTEALSELVDELQGSPLLVAYEFQHDLQRIRGSLGKVPAINGQTTDKESSRLVREWNAGRIPVLCGHPAAIGHGLNLQVAGNHVCWYSLTWNFELYDQLIRRVWRQGNKHARVIVHRILARKTIDEVVAATLGKKKRTQDDLFRALKTLKRGTKSSAVGSRRG